MSKTLVPEKGLRDTRRNRRWLALVRLLGDELAGDQAANEALAWKILRELEETR